MRIYFIELSYLLASILFILGLKGLSHPETAKRGMHLAEFGMLMAIIGTLLHLEIITYTWIILGLVLGSVVGLAMGFWVPMTAMPQRTALSHAFGAFAAALVGISEFYRHGGHLEKITMGALGFEVMLGALTTTGSLLAFAKLQGLVRGTPITSRARNFQHGAAGDDDRNFRLPDLRSRLDAAVFRDGRVWRFFSECCW